MERDLRQRTKQFALRIIKLYSALPRRGDAQILGNRLLVVSYTERGDTIRITSARKPTTRELRAYEQS